MKNQIIKETSMDVNLNITGICYICQECDKQFSTREECENCDHQIL